MPTAAPYGSHWRSPRARPPPCCVNSSQPVGRSIERIANAGEDASCLIIELIDVLARHAAGEAEAAVGALDPVINGQSHFRCNGIGQTGDRLPAQPNALRVIDRGGGLGWISDIVAPLNLSATEPTANIGRDRESEL